MTKAPIIWLSCILIITGSFFSYISASMSIGEGDVIMPLDDAYIHFQYAKQLANGEPYVYNTGDEPTSGATSFIYPYVLAIGYLLGFTGLSLGLWAMLVGTAALLIATWFIYKLGRAGKAPVWLSILGGLTFALSGAMAWHFMSGMETGLIVTFTLATLYTFITRQFKPFIAATTLLALTRPEGSIMTAIAMFLYAIRLWRETYTSAQFKQIVWLLIPFSAILIQPMLNLILTGSLNAAGSQAKSILSTIPFDWTVALRRIAENMLNIYKAFITGENGTYMPYFVAPLALIGLFKQRSFTAILLISWFLAVTLIIATLDTALWHFRRYQIPLMALLYPMALWGIMAIYDWLTFPHKPIKKASIHYATITLALIIAAVFTLPTWLEFYRLYAVNIRNIKAQPISMAHWLNKNTPEDALVAVHDVGIMRYIGERHTLDMVGLTTANAADAWRNGPGAVAEFIMVQANPPDYIAAYTTARGLNYLADTSIYGELLGGFTAEYDPADNVALGAEFQGIYRNNMLSERVIYYRPAWESSLVDRVNVANLDSENAHNYQWRSSPDASGFASEVYEMDYVDCASGCTILDGGRRINIEESFILTTVPNQDALLVTRIHPSAAGTINIYVNDNWIDTQWIPFIPGQWLDIKTLIPGEHIMSEQIAIKIIADTPDGFYMPYYHWLWQGDYPDTDPPAINLSPIATFQDNAFTLYAGYTVDDKSQLNIELSYHVTGQTTGDYKIFAHVYANVDDAPLIQADRYPTMPIGNWLQGILSDTISLNIIDMPAGTYQIALGFYNPQTFDRLSPDKLWVEEKDKRLFIGQIIISD